MKSISTIARDSAARVTLRVMAISALVMTLVVIGTLAREVVESMDSIFRSIEMNLTQSVQLGDGFQTRKLIGSLVKGGGIQGVVISDERMQSIAEAGTVTPDNDAFSLKLDHAILSKRYPLKQQSGEILGDVLIQKRVSYTPIFYLLLSLVALTVTIYAFTWHTVLAFARRLIAPVEAIPEMLYHEGAASDAHGVLEVKQLQEHLAALKANERALQNAKDDILRKEKLLYLSAQVAHDIRSPLATLDAFRADIKMDDPKKLHLMTDAISRIEEITDDLISGEFIRSISGKTSSVAEKSARREVYTTSSDMIRAAESIVESKHHEIPAKKRIKITFNASNIASIRVCSDLSQMKRILSNLISNSIDAIDSGGTISVRMEIQGSSLALIVQDDGRGISAENLKQIGHAPLSFDKAQGHGLGLYHAFQIMQQIDGKIEIESSLGAGTSVTLHLPVAPSSLADEAHPHEFVLIDDDPMVRTTWEVSAQAHKKNFRGFVDYESFAGEAHLFSVESVKVFIDENLGNGVSGSSLIPKIRALGFKNVYLATGSALSSSDEVVTGKKPPWRAAHT